MIADVRLERIRGIKDRFEVSSLTRGTYPGALCPVTLRLMLPPSLPAPITLCRNHAIFVRAHVWMQILKNVFPVQVSIWIDLMGHSQTLGVSKDILTSIQLQTSCPKFYGHKTDRGIHRH